MKHLDTVIMFFSKNEQECKKKVNDTLKEIQKGRDMLNQLENEIDQAEDGFVDKRIQEHQRQSKLVRKRTEVEEMEHLLATMAPMEECQPAEEADMTDVIDFTLHKDEDEEESDCKSFLPFTYVGIGCLVFITSITSTSLQGISNIFGV